jgi:hypothetical protein
MRLVGIAVSIAAAIAGGSGAFAQSSQAAPPTAAATVWTVRDWTRVEWWRFFEPPSGGGNNTYAYPANRLFASVTRQAARYALTGAIQYVQFARLPSDALGPGPLGLGAVYFAHAGRSDSHQVYLRYLNVQLKNLIPNVSVQAGRMPYSSGSESASGRPKIEAVKQQRIAARLVGEFEWSLYQRAFDGVRVNRTAPSWDASVVAFHPTQGGFEDAAGATMKDVTVVGGSGTLKPGRHVGGAEIQVFAFRYRDHRRVSAGPDNSGRVAHAVDVGVNAFGATVIAAADDDHDRQWDGLLWFAGQTGSWFDQSHRAASIVAEVGHQWRRVRWQPWLRAGVDWASGDRDPTDDRHGTFFQMLPTVRRYAQSAVYSQMNNVDMFTQALLRPTARLATRVDLHRIGLASSRDHWYFGSGATQSRGTVFGFSTRPSNGSTQLATIVEGSGDYTVSRHWSIGAYLGVLRGGAVVQRAFSDRDMTFAYVENSIQF